MFIIKNIIRYPIKGLSGENLEKIILEKNQVLPGDREFAFSRSYVTYEKNNPVYLRKTNFLALVKEDKLAKLETKFNPKSMELIVKLDNQIVVNEILLKEENIKKVETFFQNYLNLGIDNKPKLVQGIKIQNNNNLTHSFSDIPDKAVSIINLNTISEFEKKLGKKIAPSRFRGNLLIDNGNPWEEFNWIGKKISVGNSILEVFKKTQRCAATNVNPENAIRDINIPNEINIHYGHLDLGVYARVIKTGLVSISDELYIN
ncbi:MOSC domain-containing protein [Alphaproteobacteria bacterium]|nr:MOSC domain-containing protein [Alphaproteobacteria bacterium]